MRLYQIVLVPREPAVWLSFEETAQAFDGGYSDAQLTFQVKEPDGLVRTLTQGEMDTLRLFAPTHGLLRGDGPFATILEALSSASLP